MKKILIIFAILFPITVFGAGVQKLSTPFWQFFYKGNGQFRIQNNSLLVIDNIVDGSSNITGLALSTINTNIPNYGVEDNSPFVVWIENDNGKGRLLVKPNKKIKTVAAQSFTIVGSNSSLKKITVKVDKNALLEKSKPIGGIVANPFKSKGIFPSAVFVEGDIGALKFNCDLFGALIYAENINLLKFKNSEFASIIVGAPDKFLYDVPTGSTTNSELMAFKSGTIGKLIANRILSTIIITGGALPNCYMNEASSVFASPILAPKGNIGLLKAKEIGAWGEFEDGFWFMEDRLFVNQCSVILSSEIKKFKVKKICTQNTSVYIHGN